VFSVQKKSVHRCCCHTKPKTFQLTDHRHKSKETINTSLHAHSLYPHSKGEKAAYLFQKRLTAESNFFLLNHLKHHIFQHTLNRQSSSWTFSRGGWSGTETM